MPPGGIRVLDDHGVREALIGLEPLAGDQFGGLDRGDDRHQRHLRKTGGQLGEVQRQAGSADDHLGPRGTGRADDVVVVGHRDHAVDPHHPLGSDGVGLANLVGKRQRVGLEIVLAGIAFAAEREPGGGHQADPAVEGHVAGQTAPRNTYAHPALDQGVGDLIASNRELFHCRLLAGG